MPVVEPAGALAGGPVADLVVAVADQPVEQLGESDRGAGRRLALQVLDQGRVEPGGAGQVVAGAAEDQVADADEAFVARVGQHRDQPADELPPVADRGPGEVLEHLHELRVVVAATRRIRPRRRSRAA